MGDYEYRFQEFWGEIGQKGQTQKTVSAGTAVLKLEERISGSLKISQAQKSLTLALTSEFDRPCRVSFLPRQPRLIKSHETQNGQGPQLALLTLA